MGANGLRWAECRIRIGNQETSVTASYVSDALGDFAAAVCAILRGRRRARASFSEEPGEYRWLFTSNTPGSVRVRILGSPDLREDRPDHRGKVVLDAECPVLTLGEAVVAMLDSVEKTYGTEGYREMWVEHDYPTQRAAELRELVQKARGGA